jgi:uncharacterized metal-binding protein
VVNEDPAAVIGTDENGTVPVLRGEYADLSACETARARQAAQNRVNPVNAENEMDIDADDVKIIVLDGIVIASTVNYIQNFVMKIDTKLFFSSTVHIPNAPKI